MKFAKTHEWVKIENNVATVGITDYAQNEMGDIVYVDMPEVGRVVAIDEEVLELESVKAVAPVNSPVAGTVIEVNEELDKAPEMVNSDAYNAWLFKVEVTEESGELMSEEEYQNYLKTL
ncbi:MAG: glycine cleavage system protein GcvH [Clostridia bacterium]|nr:glycine cleavage system protein GcvH [Clostridia bacterium]